MTSLTTQQEIDSYRMERERKSYIFNIENNMELSEEFEDKVEFYSNLPLGAQEGGDCQNRRQVLESDNIWMGQVRATGVIALLCDDGDFGAGTEVNSSIKPPGWPGTRTGVEPKNTFGVDGWKYHRGHLGVNSLGFSGDDPGNLVTMHACANNPGMENIEMRIKRAVEGGRVVYMSVVPIYSSRQEIPTHIFYRAVGSGGLEEYACIENAPDSRVLDGSACVERRGSGEAW